MTLLQQFLSDINNFYHHTFQEMVQCGKSDLECPKLPQVVVEVHTIV